MKKEATKIKLEELKKKKNVIGGSLTVKERITNGVTEEGSEVFRVYVSQKVPLSALSEKDKVPDKVIIDGKEYDIDVVNIGRVMALDAHPLSSADPEAIKKWRPLRIGISSMNARSPGACSLGAFAEDNSTGDIVQLSNQHCYGLENDATVGDMTVQPSRLDGGKLLDDTGLFVRGVDIIFAGYTCNRRNATAKMASYFSTNVLKNKVDVSCASIYDDIGWEYKTPDDRELTGWTHPLLVGSFSDDIWAYGRTSGPSHRTMYTDLDGYMTVGYSRGEADFEDVVVGLQTETFKCIPGDSGSFWAENDKIAGLRFAGSNIAWIGCKWSNIQTELGVSFPIP